MEENGVEYQVKKPTMVYTNSIAIDNMVSRRCEGGHDHLQLKQSRAKRAAEYPLKLMDAFIEGLAMLAVDIVVLGFLGYYLD